MELLERDRNVFEPKALWQHPAYGPSSFEQKKPRTLRPVVLIPAYKPGDALLSIARSLLDSNATQAVIIVDDGSGKKSEAIFSALRKMDGVYVLIHALNQGKGAAIKTGLDFVLRRFKECPGVVTADADGQHAPEDIARVAFELENYPSNLILGARSFNRAVPFRSRFGNQLTRCVLQAFSGQKLADTQTGLRGIPFDLIPRFLDLRPNGYEYELEMLLMSRMLRRDIKEVSISTIYIDGNKSSHFKPLLDSLRIYAVFLKFAGVSLLSAVLDNMLFMAAFALTENILLAQGFGRIGSLPFNYFINKNAVFHSQAPVIISMLRYLCVAGVKMIGSYGTIQILVSFFGMNVLLAKIGAEMLLFVLTFIAQKRFVFKAHPSPHTASKNGLLTSYTKSN